VFTGFGKRNIAGRRRKIAGLSAFAVAAVIGVSAYAFTASNTVASHSAGAGFGAVSGYTISEPSNYTFSGDGETMTKVTFDLDKPASDVAVALTAGTPAGTDWEDCGASEASSPWAVTCTFAAPVPNAEGLKLSVAAVSHGTVTIE
jgi:hypothetical protein